MNDNLRIWKQVREVPIEAMKTIGGGRLKGMTDINPVWRIKKLTEIYGPAGEGWYTDEVSERTIQCGNEIVALVTLKLYVKTPEGWSKPIFGSGGSMLFAKEKNGMFASDEAFKMAYTDALSVACKAIGIAADVYFEKDKTKYTKEPENVKVQEGKQTRDEKKVLQLAITKLVYPNMTDTDKGDADGFCYELMENAKKATGKSKLSEFTIEELKKLFDEIDIPEALR